MNLQNSFLNGLRIGVTIERCSIATSMAGSGFWNFLLETWLVQRKVNNLRRNMLKNPNRCLHRVAVADCSLMCNAGLVGKQIPRRVSDA
jgi:hypothetical protein